MNLRKLSFDKSTSTLFLFLLLVASCSHVGQTRESNMNPDGKAGDLKILRNGSQASALGPESFFTGSVKVQPLFHRIPHQGLPALM